MADSKNITVTNYRLKQALANAEAEEMERHAKKMGEELKSSLSLKLGKVLKIYPSQDKAKVQLLDNKKKETVLIAHDFISGGMNINAYPMGTNTTDNGKNAIIPSDDLYCVVMHTSDEKHRILLSYVDLDEAFNRSSIRSGEYRMQVGENFISLTDKYINMKAQNFFINGLPYTEAYTPLADYYDKKEADLILSTLNEKIENLDLSDLEINVDSTLDSSSKNPVQNKAIYDALNNKVDKVNGKELSTNDYTNTEKEKLNSIKKVATTGDYNDLINKPVIQNIDLSDFDVDVDMQFTGVSGRDDTITISANLIQKG